MLVGDGIGKLNKSAVLIVDDTDDVRALLKMALSRDGFEVVGDAVDGVDGVLKAITLEPEFVILDHLMPRLDGDAAGQILRAVFPEIRLVAFSALLSRKPEWADGFVTKEEAAKIGEVLAGLRS